MNRRLAIVTTHPVQYHVPWFAAISERVNCKVFYLWDAGVEPVVDPGFGKVVKWDIPMLEGYEWEFIPNQSATPGTDRFSGLKNPGLFKALQSYDPAAVLIMGYRFPPFLSLIFAHPYPLIFRGDSHRLVERAGIRHRIKTGLLTMLFARIDRFLYVGKANRDYFRLNGVSDSRLFFSPHAVDMNRFSPSKETDEKALKLRQELTIQPHNLVVLFAGKFEPKKRPLELIDAFVEAAMPNAILVMLGSGELQERVAIAAAGNSQIRLAPFQNQSAMPAVYAMADLFVLPSIGPWETWGLAVNESMAMETPALVSDHVGSQQDLVTDNDTGIVFNALDLDALTSKLVEASRSDLKAMGIRARSRVERYSHARACDGLMDAFESLAGSASA